MWVDCALLRASLHDEDPDTLIDVIYSTAILEMAAQFALHGDSLGAADPILVATSQRRRQRKVEFLSRRSFGKRIELATASQSVRQSWRSKVGCHRGPCGVIYDREA